MYRKLLRREVNRLVQRTLHLSVFAIVGLAVAGIGWGLYIGSEAVTQVGFALVWLLPEPWAQWWARDAASAVAALMAPLLLLLPVPVPAKILVDNMHMREVLRVANPDDEVSRRV